MPMPMIAFISLGAPLMLLGVAAVALPIAAHLMSRRTRQTIVFPTIRLLTESRATQSNLYRIRRWVLLILRCLALILVATAFAMPSCSSPQSIEPHDGDASAGAAVVLVLDASVSLDRDPASTDGTPMLHALRTAAQQALAGLEPGVDRVNLIRAAGRPQALFESTAGTPVLGVNHVAMQEAIAGFQLSEERADLHRALQMAGDLLRDASGAAARRIIVISDMQQTNWNDLSRDGSQQPALPQGVSLLLLPLRAEETGNVALSAARCDPALPVVNLPVQLAVKATNHSQAAKEVTVAAQLDGQPIGEKTITLNAGESREIAFDSSLTTAGHHRIEFRLPDDALHADNVARLTVEARQRARVILIGDDDPASLGSASYFISRALSPRGDRNDLIEVQHRNGLDAADVNLTGVQAVILGRVDALTNSAADALVQHLHRGGGMILYSDGPSTARTLAALEQADSRIRIRQSPPVEPGRLLPMLSPWKPVQLRDFTGHPQPPQLSDGVWNSPVLTEFDEQAQKTFAQIRFHRLWSVEMENPTATILLRFNDGTPALASMGVGEGRLIVANFSPALEASDLGKYGSFVALSHSLLRHVRPRVAPYTSALVGRPIHAVVPIPVGEQPGAFAVETPDGRTLTPELVRSGSGMQVTLPQTEKAGFHRVLRNDRTVADVAVHPDPRESDLRPLDDAMLASMLKSPQVDVQVHGITADAAPPPLRGDPVWHWFIVAAMTCIAAELLLLNIWNR